MSTPQPKKVFICDICGEGLTLNEAVCHNHLNELIYSCNQANYCKKQQAHPEYLKQRMMQEQDQLLSSGFYEIQYS